MDIDLNEFNKLGKDSLIKYLKNIKVNFILNLRE